MPPARLYAPDASEASALYVSGQKLLRLRNALRTSEHLAMTVRRVGFGKM
ncbi:MAG: hypothetical protein ACK5OB_18720 [Pirellula sp.]